MQDRPTNKYFVFLLAPMLVGISGCSNQGDYGRHDPSLVSQTYTSTISRARHYLGEERDYDLPLTASEDALRVRAHDMQSIRYVGVLANIIRPPGADGFSHIAAVTQDVEVDHQRFTDFVEAATKVMQIDEVRADRLKGLDALTAQRQFAAATQRRGQNDMLIRNGVRAMRERSNGYRETLRELPVEYPDISLRELQAAYEAFRQDVVRFHGTIDERAHMNLGRAGKTASK